MRNPPPPELPVGFLAAGINCGIKNSKRDLGVLVSEHPADFWAVVTINRARAHCVERTAGLRSTGGKIRAVIAMSGNANALTGPVGKQDDETVAAAAAEELWVEPREVITASTGVLGHRLPVDKVTRGLPKALGLLSRDPASFAESIMTTDRFLKVAVREVFIEGTRIRLHAIAKGSGMIAPHLATTLCFITSDAQIAAPALQRTVEEAVQRTILQLTVDGTMSTNDMVMALANGAAANPMIEPGSEAHELFTAAAVELLEEVARAIAKDGEGATRTIEVTVNGARNVEDARALARGVAGNLLVKSAVFGADPYVFGRIVAVLGGHAAERGAPLDLAKLTVSIQGVKMFEGGTPVTLPEHRFDLKHRMREREIKVVADLGLGDGTAKGWGCDLTYDYVKINADYAAATTAAPDGSVVVNDRMSELGPTTKQKILIECLRYIDGFDGLRAVIKLGGAAMVDPRLEEEFADDVLLLREVGLRPIVVHGGGPEITRVLDKLGHTSQFVNGLRVTDKESMSVVEMVLTGSVNQRLVAALNRKGTKGVGLSGKDGGLIRAKKLERAESGHDLGQVGEVERVNAALIDMLERDGYIPVISPIGLGSDGSAFNINADSVAAEIAIALRAQKLIYLSDVPGLREGELVVSELGGDALKARIESGDITGGMLQKMQAALRALRGGVKCVHLVDGRVPHNLIAELFTDRGVGTLIRDA